MLNEKKNFVIGIGQAGISLCHAYNQKYGNSFNGINNNALYISTAIEDNSEINSRNLVLIGKEGSGKKYSKGKSIWEENIDILNDKILRAIPEDIDKIIIFASVGGGSGSSSLSFITKILSEKYHHIIVCPVLTFNFENLPFSTNEIQCLETLNQEVTSLATIYPLYNSKYENESLDKINDIFIKEVHTLLNINNLHNPNLYTPISLDKLEAESVLFSKGFLLFIKEVDFENKIKLDFGSFSEVKNIILLQNINEYKSKNGVLKYSEELIQNVKKISNRVKNARVLYGIIRSNQISENNCLIASGFNIESYINKKKRQAAGKVTNYTTKRKPNKVLKGRDKIKFDV